MKTEYLSVAQMERLNHDRLEILPSPEGANIRFMMDRLTFARVPAEDLYNALHRQRQTEIPHGPAGGNGR